MWPAQQAEFEAAAARWADVILGDVPDNPVTIPANRCFTGQPAIDEVIDDMVVLIDVGPIDGPGGILGGAGVCAARAGSLLPLVSAIQLDAADVAAMAADGLLGDVVLHELGHTIGIGASWRDRGLVNGAGTSNPVFIGAAAIAAYQAIGGAGAVPVENTGGPGTADVHWRGSVFTSELMTGFINFANPLSRVTIGSLEDLGYSVDYGTADSFGIGATFRRHATEVPARPLRETPLKMSTVIVRPDGTTVPGNK